MKTTQKMKMSPNMKENLKIDSTPELKKVQSEDLQGQRWWDEVSSLSNRCFAGSVSALVANVKIILWGNLLYIHTSDHEGKRHAMLSDI